MRGWYLVENKKLRVAMSGWSGMRYEVDYN